MERLRQLLAYVSAQMSLLTVSQRVAIGLCAAMIAGSLLWLMQWSSTPEMTPLLAYDFTYDELSEAESALRLEGIPFARGGMRMLVRPGDQARALGVLSSANALPEGSLYDMVSVVSDTNPFMPPEARQTAVNYAKGNELAKIIATFPFVKSARVMINPEKKRRLGRSTDMPTASVTVALTPGKEMTSQIVEGFAKLVAGAVPGLKPYNVNVIDGRTGRSHGTSHPDQMGASDYLDQVKQREAHFLDKIMTKLADIPGVLVAVSVELDTSKRVKQTNTYSEPAEKKTTSQETKQSSASQPTEPGVQANTGVAITAGPAGQSGSTEDSTTENFPPLLTETETVEQPPFERKSVSAAVSIPRSFLVGVFKAKYADESDPKDDDARFTTIRDEQLARVKKSVELIVLAEAPEDVEVDVYPDMEWGPTGSVWKGAPGPPLAQDRAEALDTMSLVRGYGPQVGLVMLALASLFMMTRIVRKSAQLAAVRAKLSEPDEFTGEEGVLTVGAYPVGEAEVTEGILPGKEVDEDTLRYEELGQEVSKMVEADPGGAADLIRRWVEDME